MASQSTRIQNLIINHTRATCKEKKTVLTLPLNVPVAGESINFLTYASVWQVFMVCETDALSLFTLLNSLPCSEGSTSPKSNCMPSVSNQCISH